MIINTDKFSIVWQTLDIVIDLAGDFYPFTVKQEFAKVQGL